MPQFDEPSQYENLNEVLYKIIVNDIFEYEENLVGSYPLIALEILEKKGLIRKVYSNEKKENSKVQVIPWLKTRIFEEVVAKEGLERYLDDLLKSESEKPYKEVKLNSLIASSHFAFSINKFIFQLLTKINKTGKYLSDSVMSPIEEVLAPNDKYTVKSSSIKFDFDLIEGIRLNLQKYIYDSININEKKLYRRKSTFNDIYIKTPEDFVPVFSLEFEYNKLMESIRLLTSEEYLKVVLLKRYIVLIKENGPIIYITNRKIGYSPSINKIIKVKDEDSKKEIEFIKQSIFHYANLGNKISSYSYNKETKTIDENLKLELKLTNKSISDYETTSKNNALPCSLCGNLATMIAYHESKGLVIICAECSKKPVIKAIIESRLIPK